MFSLRRYAGYLALTACVLLTFNYLRQDGSNTMGAGVLDSPTAQYTSSFNWRKIPIRNPIAKLTPLPKAPVEKLRTVQHDFPAESAEQSKKRKGRQMEVRKAFERSWQSYRKHAWTKDELAPISGSSKSTFGGWAATLVDSLDTLWIMEMKDDFEDAVDAAMTIDLSKTSLDEINVFETTIRHLGGLLAAYDLSQDERLLQKAIQFGDMLIVAFDTPNHMPICRWRPQDATKGSQKADLAVLVAEIGSLTMEFTRLSQVTGDPRWYDAVERIVREFEAQQYQTHLPGMWPVTVNARRPDFTQDTLFTLSAMSDSLYEYFPKMYALLGGVEKVYEKLYSGSMKRATEHLLFRPMVPDEADILISGSVRAIGHNIRLEAQGQHLVCFAGGMFALGGRLFNEPEHLKIARKLVDGCIWTYKALPHGIMPEVFNMVPCEDPSRCPWNETKWHEEVMRQPLYPKMKASDAVEKLRLPKGFSKISDTRYILRPEAIESVFVLYRVTGEEYLQDAAWDMFQAIEKATRTKLAYAALSDVTFPGSSAASKQTDSMESFWMAETLKYFYLMFSEPDVISLDDYVFNTEAHPFRRPTVA